MFRKWVTNSPCDPHFILPQARRAALASVRRASGFVQTGFPESEPGPHVASPFSLRVFRAAETDVGGREAGRDRGPFVDYTVRQRAPVTAAADHIPGLGSGRRRLQNGGEAAHGLGAGRL